MERTITATSDGRAGAGRRWAAYLAVIALLFQLLLPVSAVRAGGLDEALLASICHSSDEAAPTAPATVAHDHCSFCQLHLGMKLLPAPAVGTTPVPEPTALYAVIPSGAEGIAPPSLQSPQTRRGPPSLS